MARIVIIYPRETDPPVEINSFRARQPRYGLLSVATYLKKYGHEVCVFCELTGSRVDWSAVREADYVCFSFLSFCAPRAYMMADRVRREFGKIVIMGGSHCSVMPEDALAHSDYVVRNEGEETTRELLDALEDGSDLHAVRGLSFRDAHGNPVHNPDRPFMEDISFELDQELLPEYRSLGLWWNLMDAAANGAPRVPMPVFQASRGCPERCKFCVVRRQLGSKYRKRPLNVVVSEIENSLRRFNNPYIFFVDNDLSLDPEFSIELFETILKRFGPWLRPYVFCRTGVSAHTELLATLEKFHEITMGVGFEALGDTALSALGKGHNGAQILDAVEILKRYKIKIHGLFIFGGEDDTPAHIEQAVDFSLEHGFFNVGLTPLYDFPGENGAGQSKLIPDHLLMHRDWRFYSGNFVVHFPRLMRPSELQDGLLRAYDRFFRESPVSMVPFMPTRPTIKRYIRFLQEVEASYYGPGGERLDHKLEGRGVDDMPQHVPVRVPRSALYAEAARFLTLNVFRGVSWRLLRGMLLSGARPQHTEED